jgi:hypothetical protein
LGEYRLSPASGFQRERERCKERERAELGRRGLSRRLSSPAAQRKEMVRGESEDAWWLLAGGARR